MAKVNKAVTSFNLVLVLSLLIFVSMAESRMLLGGIMAKKGTPQCDLVVAVESGDTCFDIEQKFQLTAGFFGSINPNLNCDALFVGQWVCVDGTVN